MSKFPLSHDDSQVIFVPKTDMLTKKKPTYTLNQVPKGSPSGSIFINPFERLPVTTHSSTDIY